MSKKEEIDKQRYEEMEHKMKRLQKKYKDVKSVNQEIDDLQTTLDARITPSDLNDVEAKNTIDQSQQMEIPEVSEKDVDDQAVNVDFCNQFPSILTSKRVTVQST